MNAPETHITEPINAAHAVLIEIDEALPIARISKLIGCPVSETKKQLKELARLGLIETELRKGGASFYRLTAAPAEMQVTSAQMQVTSGEMQATSTDWTALEMNYLAPEDYELPPADPEFLALANRELGQQLEAAKAERDDLRARLDALTEQWEADTGRLTADLRAAIEAKSHAINEADRLRAQLAGKERTHQMLMERNGASALLDAVGYIVRAAKRKPRTIMDQGKAREAALSAIRAGAQRAEVFALLPVGVARKGAEWRAKA